MNHASLSAYWLRSKVCLEAFSSLLKSAVKKLVSRGERDVSGFITLHMVLKSCKVEEVRGTTIVAEIFPHLKGRGTSDNINQLGRNGGLTGTVIGDGQAANNVSSVLGGIVHSIALRRHLRGMTLDQSPVHVVGKQEFLVVFQDIIIQFVGSEALYGSNQNVADTVNSPFSFEYS